MTSEALTCGAVVLGKFAPAMFHPTWFESLKLVGEAEAAAATKSESIIVSDNGTRFVLAGMEIQVSPDRMQITTAREDLHDPLRDLLKSVLSILDTAPAQIIGINWSQHFKAPDEAKWHAFGDRMAPKDFWKKNWKAHAGLMRLQIRLERDDEYQGSLNVHVEPSSVILPGVFAKINDHYENQGPRAGDLSLLIEKIWEKSKINAIGLIDSLRKDVENG